MPGLTMMAPRSMQETGAVTFMGAAAAVPMVYEGQSGAPRDLMSLLFNQGIVFISGPICWGMAESVTAQLLYLDRFSDLESAALIINSPGGTLDAGWQVHEAMMAMDIPIRVIVPGQASSMAALLVAAGTRGERIITENAKIMIHGAYTTGLSRLTAFEADVEADVLHDANQRLFDHLCRYCILDGERAADVEKRVARVLMTRTDRYFTAEEALAFGLVDHIRRSWYPLIQTQRGRRYCTRCSGAAQDRRLRIPYKN